MHNVLSYVPYKEKTKLTCYLKQIFNFTNKQMAIDIAQLIAHKYQNSYPKVSHLVEERLEFTLTYLCYPNHHRRKIRTTNLIEEIIKRDLNNALSNRYFPKQRILFALCLYEAYGN